MRVSISMHFSQAKDPLCRFTAGRPQAQVLMLVFFIAVQCVHDAG